MQKLLTFLVGFLFSVTMFAQALLNQTNENGLKQGKWMKKNKDNETIYIGQFKDGQPYGVFQYLYPKGKLKSEVTHKNDSEVYVKNYYETGKIKAVGKFVNRKKDSTWVYYNANQIMISVENYKLGVKHGTWRNYYTDGVILQKLEWENGIKNGPLVNYYATGKPKMEAVYVNDSLTGSVKFFNQKGLVYIHGAYKNAVKHSWWYYFDETGAIVDKERYVNGVMVEGTKKNETKKEDINIIRHE
jgi:antitoxin component YwqK of YwqJK toxin-antitoxin module